MTTTIAHMHNLNGSAWNAEIAATRAEVIEARGTLLRIHSTMHTRGVLGAPQSGTAMEGWTEACSIQAEAQAILRRNPEQFPPSIVAAASLAESKNAIRSYQLFYALTLPLRRRRKGHKGVFLEEIGP